MQKNTPTVRTRRRVKARSGGRPRSSRRGYLGAGLALTVVLCAGATFAAGLLGRSSRMSAKKNSTTSLLNHSILSGHVNGDLTAGVPMAQTASSSPVNLNLLTLQAAPDHLRKLLGHRFTDPGREITSLSGVLTVGTVQHTVQIVRTQSDSGESVAVNGTGPALTWAPTQGAITNSGSSSAPATGADRAMTERLVLDTADGFITAQLRGASYCTVASNAAPPGMPDDYTGPAWSLVRVAEPTGASQAQAESPARLYFINTTTGLIDRVISQEAGQTVTAELTAWTAVNGETMPAHITWSINGQVVMDFAVTTYAFSAAH